MSSNARSSANSYFKQGSCGPSPEMSARQSKRCTLAKRSLRNERLLKSELQLNASQPKRRRLNASQPSESLLKSELQLSESLLNASPHGASVSNSVPGQMQEHSDACRVFLLKIMTRLSTGHYAPFRTCSAISTSCGVFTPIPSSGGQ